MKVKLKLVYEALLGCKFLKKEQTFLLLFTGAARSLKVLSNASTYSLLHDQMLEILGLVANVELKTFPEVGNFELKSYPKG